MSQEWDEVVNEVDLIITRLNAFRFDLLAAADGGNLTDAQCNFVNEITAVISAALLRCLELNATAMPRNTEKGETKA